MRRDPRAGSVEVGCAAAVVVLAIMILVVGGGLSWVMKTRAEQARAEAIRARDEAAWAQAEALRTREAAMNDEATATLLPPARPERADEAIRARTDEELAVLAAMIANRPDVDPEASTPPSDAASFELDDGWWTLEIRQRSGEAGGEGASGNVTSPPDGQDPPPGAGALAPILVVLQSSAVWEAPRWLLPVTMSELVGFDAQSNEVMRIELTPAQTEHFRSFINRPFPWPVSEMSVRAIVESSGVSLPASWSWEMQDG